MRPIQRIFPWSASVILALNCLGCNLLSIPTPVAWSLTGTPSAAPETPSPDLPIRTPPPPQATARRTPAAVPLPAPEQSTWLVYSRIDGKTLIALPINPKSARQPVTIELPDPLIEASDLRAGASPIPQESSIPQESAAGPWLALRTGRPAGSAPQNLALRLANLETGALEEISPLLSPALEKQVEAAPSGRLPEPAMAVMDENSLDWSPDGRYLAFIAAVDGPSSDLYVYDLQTKQTRRLTTGTRQAATPVWSPDSRWVVTQEVQTFQSGAGWQVTAVWAAAVDHSEIRRLYTPPETSARERFLGWTGPDTLVVATQTPAGIQNVRELPLSTRWLYPIFKGPCATIAFDPSSRWFYFTSQGQASSPSALPLLPGLYRVGGPFAGVKPELVLAGEWSQVTWQSHSGRFVASGRQGAMLVAPTGSEELIKNETHALFSPDGRWIAGWGDARTGASNGVHLYQPNGTLLQEVTGQAVQALVWTPNLSGVYFQAGSTLFHAAFPNPEPQEIDADVLPLSLGLAPAQSGEK